MQTFATNAIVVFR